MGTDTPFFIFQSLGIFAVLLFIILPVAVAVIFFIAAADINKIKKLKMENDALLLSRLERIEKSIEEIRKLANIGFTPPAPAVSSVREKAIWFPPFYGIGFYLRNISSPTCGHGPRSRSQDRRRPPPHSGIPGSCPPSSGSHNLSAPSGPCRPAAEWPPDSPVPSDP